MMAGDGSPCSIRAPQFSSTPPLHSAGHHEDGLVVSIFPPIIILPSRFSEKLFGAPRYSDQDIHEFGNSSHSARVTHILFEVVQIGKKKTAARPTSFLSFGIIVILRCHIFPSSYERVTI